MNQAICDFSTSNTSQPALQGQLSAGEMLTASETNAAETKAPEAGLMQEGDTGRAGGKHCIRDPASWLHLGSGEHSCVDVRCCFTNYSSPDMEQVHDRQLAESMLMRHVSSISSILAS